MKENPFLLKKKNIIITGASSGIGRQTAISCSEMGANLILFGRDLTRLNETLSLLDQPERHQIAVIDLTDFENIEQVVRDAVSRFGKIDGLINSAGITTTKPFKMVKPDNLDHFLRTNVTSAFNLTRICVKPDIINSEGASIIFISSVMGMVGEIGKSLYSVTKGALLSGSKSLALELASKKIRVNCISPGVVITPMSEKAIFNQDEESLERITKLHPLGLGQPSDVANACVFLLSDSSRWITGSNLVIDGGYTAR